ncbi:MAG: Gfo/Idh/MocA family oxidoreductase [Acidobacteria bacterium]|nr:Gfo/Idh/MocA family oxidoreductase [Acidobacteriota bacterium]
MSENLSRRNFVHETAGAAIVSALGQNNKTNLGVVGAGGRGNYLMDMFYLAKAENVTITWVCDTYKGNLNRAKDKVQTKEGTAPKAVIDYQEILADKSVDCVIIATPEHLHYPMAVAALKAGKNIYLEKPIAHTIEEGAEIVKLAQKAGKVVQVGTQNRSNTLYIEAQKMVKEGMIGECHYVRAFWYRNFLSTDPVPAAWRYIIPPDAAPENTDFARFLGGAPKRGFDKGRYFQWRNYWDYSGGISTDLLVHQTDISNFVLGKTVPRTCMASGGIYQWGAPDDRDVPDTLSAIYEYTDKFHLNYSCFFGNEWAGYGEQFMGHEGTIEVLNRQNLRFYPEKFKGKPPAKVAARKDLAIDRPGNDNLAVQAHLMNWLDAVRGKGKVIAPPEVGQMAAIPGHMATLSYRRDKKIYWDEKTEKYRFT